MHLDLPSEFKEEPSARESQRRSRMLLIALVMLWCAWQLFELPGTVLKRVRVPEDMPEFGFGLATIQITEDGTWVLRRQAYVDRMGRYDLRADGTLTKSKERGLANEPNRTGAMTEKFVRMEGRSYLDVSPSRAYRSARQELRTRVDKLAGHDRELLADEDDPYGPAGIRSLPEPLIVGPPAVSEKYVELNLLTVGGEEAAEELPDAVVGQAQLQYQILDGHEYYAVTDSAAYIPPNLWLTTDQGRYLHRVRASEASGSIVIEPEQSRALEGLLLAQTQGINLGRDPGSGLLYLVLANGMRYWFDAQSLEPKGLEQLPGSWEREYGALTWDIVQRLEYPNYNMESGLPLSEAGFKRLTRVMLIIMLAGLVLLARLWRTPWKYISAATTAATTSNSKPSTTS
jgi:hypothetical protein